MSPRTRNALALGSFLLGSTLAFTFTPTSGALGISLRVLALALGVVVPALLLIRYR